jgi:hypothetical protein
MPAFDPLAQGAAVNPSSSHDGDELREKAQSVS